MNKIEIFTDGSCSPNPGKGGWAVLIDGIVLFTGYEPKTTNNRMELIAVLNALRWTLRCLGPNTNGILHTDSTYVRNACYGKPTKNLDIIKDIRALLKKLNIVVIVDLNKHDEVNIVHNAANKRRLLGNEFGVINQKDYV